MFEGTSTIIQKFFTLSFAFYHHAREYRMPTLHWTNIIEAAAWIPKALKSPQLIQWRVWYVEELLFIRKIEAPDTWTISGVTHDCDEWKDYSNITGTNK